MVSHKISRWLPILLASAVSCVYAAEKDSEVFIQRSPTIPTHFHHVSPHQSPVKLSPMKPQRNYRSLVIGQPLAQREVGQLLDRDCREIYLNGVGIYDENEGNYLKQTSLVISPEFINPDVEVLSVKCCGLTDDLIKGIVGFKNLRTLILFAHFISDAGVISSISQIESLQSLTLSNLEITNDCIPSLLAMPNLVELDLSINQGINDGVSQTLFEETKLQKLNVQSTGMSRPEQRRLAQKYRSLGK
jgi:Leucine-rich repeat (LRR) protein